jgi:hypothetical protein
LNYYLNFEVYLSVTEKSQQQSELFANWAKMLLQDFNEIDRYLLDPTTFCPT